MRRKSGSSSELLTASELSITLGISRTKFFRLQPTPKKAIARNYGQVAGFAVIKLPEELKELLRQQMVRHGYAPPLEFVRARLQERRRNSSPMAFRQRLAPHAKAFSMREVMNRYFAALDNGKGEHLANREARAEHVRQFGESCEERKIRRIGARVDDCGGPDLAPIDAYSDLKSVPNATAKGKGNATARRRRPPRARLPVIDNTKGNL